MAETREFNLQVNIGTLGPVDVMMEDPSPGPHMMEISDVREVTSEKEGGKTSLRFSVMDIEENSITRGVSTQVVIGTDWTKEFNLRHLVNLLLGMGVKAERVKGIVRINAAVFVGKRCPVYVKAPPSEVDELGRKQFANKNFITLDMYEAAKRMAMSITARIPASNQRMAQTAQPGPGAMTVTPPPQAANGSIITQAANQPAVGLEDLFA